MATNDAEDFLVYLQKDPPYPTTGTTGEYSMTRDRLRSRRKQKPSSPSKEKGVKKRKRSQPYSIIDTLLVSIGLGSQFHAHSDLDDSPETSADANHPDDLSSHGLVVSQDATSHGLNGSNASNASNASISQAFHSHHAQAQAQQQQQQQGSQGPQVNRMNQFRPTPGIDLRASKFSQFSHKMGFKLRAFLDEYWYKLTTIDILKYCFKLFCVCVTLLLFFVVVVLPLLCILLFFLPLYMFACHKMVNSPTFCLKQHWLLAVANYRLKGLSGLMLSLVTFSYQSFIMNCLLLDMLLFPQISNVEIEKPVFITGVAQSGVRLAHHVISSSMKSEGNNRHFTNHTNHKNHTHQKGTKSTKGTKKIKRHFGKEVKKTWWQTVIDWMSSFLPNWLVSNNNNNNSNRGNSVVRYRLWEVLIPSILLRYPMYYWFHAVNWSMNWLYKMNLFDEANMAYYKHLQSWTNEEFLMSAHGLTGDIYVEIQAISFFENLQKQYLGVDNDDFWRQHYVCLLRHLLKRQIYWTGHKQIIMKSESLMWCIDDIMNEFKDCKIIVTLRHPKDLISLNLSLFQTIWISLFGRKTLKLHWTMATKNLIWRRYQQCNRLMNILKKEESCHEFSVNNSNNQLSKPKQSQLLVVRYCDMVDQFHNTFLKCFEHCNIPITPELEDYLNREEKSEFLNVLQRKEDLKPLKYYAIPIEPIRQLFDEIDNFFDFNYIYWNY